MIRFSTVCIDNITKGEMILADCSFNNACMFLSRENRDNRFGRYKGTESDSLNVKRILFENATFLHDEERGCLIRKE